MTEEFQTDVTKVLSDTKATIATLETDEKAAVSWVKTHVALLIGLAAFIGGWATRFIHL